MEWDGTTNISMGRQQLLALSPGIALSHLAQQPTPPAPTQQRTFACLSQQHVIKTRPEVKQVENGHRVDLHPAPVAGRGKQQKTVTQQ
jgi:hypothetical protein